jgi:formiminotetrahydrofolate cyclodeaminase
MADNKNMMDMTVAEFIAATADKTPTPGGGSVAGVVGSLAAALGEMALNFTRGKKKFAEHEDLYARLAQRLAKARGMFQLLVADDVAAYSLYQDSARQSDGPDKAAAVQLALAAAVDVPRQASKLALAVMEDLLALAPRCNPYLISDLTAGAALAAATVRLCDYNVRVNVPRVTDQAAARDIRGGSRADLARAVELLADIEQAAKDALP